MTFIGYYLEPLDLEQERENRRMEERKIKRERVRLRKEREKKEKENIQLKNKLNILPDEMLREIYCYLLPLQNFNQISEFMKTYLIFSEFKKAYLSNSSQSLNIFDIRPFIPTLLAFPKLTKICILEFYDFKCVWEKEKRKNDKTFVKMTRGNSFAQSLLMYRYH